MTTSRRILIGVAAVLLIAGGAFGSYRLGWWPGSESADATQDSLFDQSRINEVRGDQVTATKIHDDLATAGPASKAALLQQGHDITATACTASTQIHDVPSDLGDFLHQNCSGSEIAPTSEFAQVTGAGTGSGKDPDPGAN